MPGPGLLMNTDSIGLHDGSIEDTVIAPVIYDTREGQRRLFFKGTQPVKGKDLNSSCVSPGSFPESPSLSQLESR